MRLGSRNTLRNIAFVILYSAVVLLGCVAAQNVNNNVVSVANPAEGSCTDVLGTCHYNMISSFWQLLQNDTFTEALRRSRDTVALPLLYETVKACNQNATIRVCGGMQGLVAWALQAALNDAI